jgi:hypothetical protein
MTCTKGSAMAASMLGCDDGDVAASSSIYGNNNPNGHVRILPGRRRSLEGPTVRPRERKPSETVPVDLLRVVEESEELAPAASTGDRTGRMERINLGNGKWPNDFLDALKVPSSSSPSRPIAIRKPSLSSGDFAPADPLGLSASFSVNSSASSPPRDSVDSLSPSLSFPSPGISHPLAAAAARRPTQCATHSVDAPVLAPIATRARTLRLSVLVQAQAESHCAGTARVMGGAGHMCQGEVVPKTAAGVDAIATHLRQCPSRSREPCLGSLPARSTPHPSPSPSSPRRVDPLERAGSTSSSNSPSLIPRGRFQSEVDGSSSRRRPRPNSYDEFGAKPRRSRFESMFNLGVASGEQASASDLMARDATEGSMSRQTLVVREEGKAPTHFVSDPVICVGGTVINWGTFFSNWGIVLAADSLAPSIVRST